MASGLTASYGEQHLPVHRHPHHARSMSSQLPAQHMHAHAHSALAAAQQAHAVLPQSGVLMGGGAASVPVPPMPFSHHPHHNQHQQAVPMPMPYRHGGYGNQFLPPTSEHPFAATAASLQQQQQNASLAAHSQPLAHTLVAPAQAQAALHHTATAAAAAAAAAASHGLPDPRAHAQQVALVQQQQAAAAAAAAAKKKKASQAKRKHGSRRPYPPEPPELGTKYEYIRFLGRGSYGDVSEAKVRANGKHVAVKHIFNIFENTIEAKRILREIRILRVLQHKHVVKLVDILPPDDLSNFHSLDIIFEFVDTDLAKLIQTKQYFIELHVKYMLFQILCGLKYLHSCNIVHRDAKPANILVNEDCSIKICDFGLARSLTDNNALRRDASPARSPPFSPQMLGSPNAPAPPTRNSPFAAIPSLCTNPTPSPNAMSTSSSIASGAVPPRPSITRQLTKHVVTRWYRAPEIILRNDYTTQVDLWSAGCILGELLSMQKENCPKYSERAPLFPGTSSNMSKSPKHAMRAEARKDQLNVIFDVIGTPAVDELKQMSPQVYREVSMYEPRSKMTYRERFPGASREALDLLDKLLQFDPSKRLTAEQALAHPFLTQVRAGLRDSELVAPPTLGLDFEFEDRQLSEDNIRSLIVQEIAFYNPDMRRN